MYLLVFAGGFVIQVLVFHANSLNKSTRAYLSNYFNALINKLALKKNFKLTVPLWKALISLSLIKMAKGLKYSLDQSGHLKKAILYNRLDYIFS